MILYKLNRLLINMIIVYRYFINTVLYGYSYLYNGSKIVYVNPDSIKYKMKGGSEFKKKSLGVIRGGKWDLNVDIFDDTSILSSFKEHFVNNVEWENTNIYKRAIEKYSRYGKYRNYNSVNEVNNRFVQLDKMYNDIKLNGYKTQDCISSKNDIYPSYLKEITVNISRNGNYILDDGRHRLSMAKILKIERIPVLVLVVHEKNFKN